MSEEETTRFDLGEFMEGMERGRWLGDDDVVRQELETMKASGAPLLLIESPNGETLISETGEVQDDNTDHDNEDSPDNLNDATVDCPETFMNCSIFVYGRHICKMSDAVYHQKQFFDLEHATEMPSEVKLKLVLLFQETKENLKYSISMEIVATCQLDGETLGAYCFYIDKYMVKVDKKE